MQVANKQIYKIKINVFLGNATEWSVRLTKQWQPLFGDFAEARLRCSEHFYGPFCQAHCVPRNPHQECDQETGQRRCLEGYRGVDCTEREFS